MGLKNMNFVFVIVTCLYFIGVAKGQIQYTHFYINNSSNGNNIRIDSSSFISYGSIDIDNLFKDHLILHRIPKDTNCILETFMTTIDSNNIFCGLNEINNNLNYGFLFKSDSCFYIFVNDTTFMHTYTVLDTFKIIKCGNLFEYYFNGSKDYENSKVLNNDLDVIVRNKHSNLTYGYVRYRLDSSCTLNSITSLPFYDLNIKPFPGYAIVTSDTLVIRYFEKYNIDSSYNLMSYWSIYDDQHNIIGSDSILNKYGTNIQEIDVSTYSLTQNDLYMLVVTGTNKNRNYYLRFKYLK